MLEGQSQNDVDAMMKSDPEFRQLYHRHRELDKQVLDAELGVLPLDDTTLVRMKKEKLNAKDRSETPRTFGTTRSTTFATRQPIPWHPIKAEM